MANDCCGCCDCACPNQLEIARLRADLSTARERGEALAGACRTLVEYARGRVRIFRWEWSDLDSLRAALRAWEEGK